MVWFVSLQLQGRPNQPVHLVLQGEPEARRGICRTRRRDPLGAVLSQTMARHPLTSAHTGEGFVASSEEVACRFDDLLQRVYAIGPADSLGNLPCVAHPHNNICVPAVPHALHAIAWAS